MSERGERPRERIRYHESPLAGVDPMSACTARAYPRHTHDQYGIGVIDRGAHASWSGRGPVEAGAAAAFAFAATAFADPRVRHALDAAFAHATTAPRDAMACEGAPLTLAELAREAGLSRYQLLRGFSRALGLRPHAYVVQRRLGLARRLMRDGHALADVALRAGFYDQSHLTRAFARQFGVTPRRYAAPAD